MSEPKLYKVRRVFPDPDTPTILVEKDLSLEQAQAIVQEDQRKQKEQEIAPEDLESMLCYTTQT